MTKLFSGKWTVQADTRGFRTKRVYDLSVYSTSAFNPAHPGIQVCAAFDRASGSFAVIDTTCAISDPQLDSMRQAAIAASAYLDCHGL